MPSINEAIKSRISANAYDPTFTLTNDEIADLIDTATHAPSAFNAQNWRFIALCSQEAKARLLPLAYGQQKVVDAAVTFIVCGALDAHQTLPTTLRSTLEAGIIGKDVYDMWIGAAAGMYGENPQLQRDEAMRSGSLVAMTLMLAAREKGLVSTPMIGFDSDAVAKEFNLAESEIPVMLVTVGHPASGNWPRKARKPVSDVLTYL